MDEVQQTEGGWRSSGWVALAGLFLIVTGAWDVLYGIALLVKENWAAISPDRLIVFDVTTWAWVITVTGGLKLASGLGLLRGQSWARAVAILLVISNMFVHWAFTNANPATALLSILFNVLILYALVVPEKTSIRQEGYWDVSQAQRPPPTQIPR